MPAGFFSPGEVSKKAPLSLVPKCGACGLYKTCESPKMPLDGEGGRGILIVGEAPGRTEDAKGKPFVGKTGQLLEQTLHSLKVDLRGDCWITNALICRPVDNKIPDERMVDYCRPNVMKVIQEHQPHTIVLLGARAVRSVIGWLWKEDPGGINRWLGWSIPNQRLNAWICPTWHPSYLERARSDKDRRIEVMEAMWRGHLKKACSHRERPWEQAPDYNGQVYTLSDDGDAAEAVRTYQEEGNPIAFDFETDRIKPDREDSTIVCCSVSNGITSHAFPWGRKVRKAMKSLLRSPIPKYGWNCFSGDTRFLTREYGVVSLRDANGHNVTVLNHRGEWTPATIRCFGIQETQEVTFSRRNYLNTVWATGGHQWVLSDGRWVSTLDLQSRKHRKPTTDEVPYLCAPKVITDEGDYIRGVNHGIVLGDGSKRKDRVGSFYVRLCHEKKKLLRFFGQYSRSYPPSYKGDPIVYVNGQEIDLKKPPPSSVSDSYLIGFARGLLATDGCVNHAGQISLTNEKGIVDWCEKHLPRVGFLFQGKSNPDKYKRCYNGSSDSWTIYFSRESVDTVDLLKHSHREKWKRVCLGPYKFRCRGGKRKERVYCAVVPNGRSFTLAGGLVTGNCKFESRWAMKLMGVEVNNWAWDGMIATHVLDNRPEICSLKFQAFTRLGMESYDDYMKPFLKSDAPNLPNRIREAGMEKTLFYCGLDSLLEFKLAEVQRKQLGVEV